jgi:N-carbamoyl-L-amino-acid hydrolase
MKRREFGMMLVAGASGLAMRPQERRPGLRVDGKRLNYHLTELSQYGRNPQGGVSRVAYSDADLQAREYVKGLMGAAKLQVSVDAAANIIGRKRGLDPALPPLVIGSHIDSVPEGGNYDGDVGSMGAIEVAQAIVEANEYLVHSLEVIIFSNEEGGTIGSHALSGELSQKQLAQRTNSGKTIEEGIRFLGGDPSGLSRIRRKPGDIRAYLELHIEQGGILESEKLDIGVVQGIVGITQWDVTIEGFANHAGTTPMNQRKDALLAAARFIDMVNQTVTSQPGRQVGTVGKIQALPGAYNVIPGKVVVGLELRDLESKKIEAMYQKIRTEADRIAMATGTTFDFVQVNTIVPALTDNAIRKVINETATERGLKTKLMPSGAGHDAQEMARLGPVGMIFIPSVGGISHSPKEYSKAEDIENGANVLLHTLMKLDRG